MFNVKRQTLHSVSGGLARSKAELGKKTGRNPNFRSASSKPLQRQASVEGGGFTQSVFSGPDLDPSRGPLVEQLISTDQDSLDHLYSLVFQRDTVCGPAAELYSTLPFGEFGMSGIGDQTIEKAYIDMFNSIDVVGMLPEMCLQFLVMGRSISHLIFDESLGYWSDVIYHDLSSIEITNIPVRSAPYIIDINPTKSQALKEFANNTDPRVKEYFNQLDPVLKEKLLSGQKIQLNPDNTIYLPRKMFASDHTGVSIYLRLLYILAFEWSIIDTTIIAAKRRPSSVRLIRAGIDGWEPEPEELSNLAGIFMQSEQDPAGSIIAIRQGIDVDDLGGFRDVVWKMTDEWDWLTGIKSKLLGIDEGMLTGESSFTFESTGLTLFIERLLAIRGLFTKHVILDKLCRTTAQANNFVRRASHELDHRIRIRKAGISGKHWDKDLIIPEITYTKSLRPLADEDRMNMLNTLEEKGLPVTMQEYAQTAGYDLSRVLNELDEDVELRTRLKEYFDTRKKLSAEGGEDEGMSFASFKGMDTDAKNRIKDKLSKSDMFISGNFMGIRKEDVGNLIDSASNGDAFKVNGKQKSALRYLIAKETGSAQLMDKSVAKDVTEWFHHKSGGDLSALSKEEIVELNRLSFAFKDNQSRRRIVSPGGQTGHNLGKYFLTGRTPSFLKRGCLA